MKRSPRNTIQPRKQPRQARAIATRAAVLEAAAQVLESVGYEKMTTTRVAERAGTSVGSLYQYFPSKEAILLALLEAKTARVDSALAAAFALPANVPLAHRIHAIVDGLFREKGLRPRLSAELARQAPRLEKAMLMKTMLDRTHGMVRALLEAHRDEIDVDDVDLSAWLLVHAVTGITDAAVLGPSARLVEPAFVDAVVGHLLGAVGVRRSRARSKRAG
jgi:AcrR family transcriptional regulator